MLADCLATERSFGVVLIARGAEVGGGDIRRDVGTVAMLHQTALAPDGRLLLMTTGGERFRVLSWLPEEPYPRAIVEELVDDVTTDLSTQIAETFAELRLIRDLWCSIGGPTLEVGGSLGADFEEQVWRLC